MDAEEAAGSSSALDAALRRRMRRALLSAQRSFGAVALSAADALLPRSPLLAAFLVDMVRAGRLDSSPRLVSTSPSYSLSLPCVVVMRRSHKPSERGLRRRRRRRLNRRLGRSPRTQQRGELPPGWCRRSCSRCGRTTGPGGPRRSPPGGVPGRGGRTWRSYGSSRAARPPQARKRPTSHD